MSLRVCAVCAVRFVVNVITIKHLAQRNIQSDNIENDDYYAGNSDDSSQRTVATSFHDINRNQPKYSSYRRLTQRYQTTDWRFLVWRQSQISININYISCSKFFGCDLQGKLSISFPYLSSSLSSVWPPSLFHSVHSSFVHDAFAMSLQIFIFIQSRGTESDTEIQMIIWF